MTSKKSEGARVPSLRKHANGQAFVRIGGRNKYFGLHGTKDSKRRYDRFLLQAAGVNAQDCSDMDTMSFLLISCMEEPIQPS